MPRLAPQATATELANDRSIVCDHIELRIMKEGVTRVTSLRTGEVDFANIDRLREAATEEAFLQAAHSYVKGYENLHSYKLRFETTWLEK